MNDKKIKEKFGDYYKADENTFKMGIDIRITEIISERFEDQIVLETCSGAGFTTIPLARKAKHIYTVEINKLHQEQSIENIDKAMLSNKVTFILGDILDNNLIIKLPKHELQHIYMDREHVLYCLYFGNLIRNVGSTKLIVKA
ncbi:MAG: hypothetical protein AB1521_07560 [Bacteroidota bacterium]